MMVARRRQPRRSTSEPELLCLPYFHPLVPRVAKNIVAVSSMLHSIDGRESSWVIASLHTRLCLARFKWYVSAEHRVPCVALKYIEVDEPHRRQGHARQALMLLRLAAADNRLGLVIQDVVSPHIESIVQSLDGRRLPGGSGRGAGREINYWIPAASEALWRHDIDRECWKCSEAEETCAVDDSCFTCVWCLT